MQGICDNRKKFTDIFAGYPGSLHDSRVFKNSTIYTNLNEYCLPDYHIRSDWAYGCTPVVMVPYIDNGMLNRKQKLFNRHLSSNRVHIEHTFGLQRFRQLYYCKIRGIKHLCHFIRACLYAT